MSRLFESTWREGYEFYERCYDTNIGRSTNSKIKLKHEWYEKCSTGLYSSVLDTTIKLDKRQGNAKQGREHYGFLDPMYRNIRDNYWRKDKCNLSPRVFYLDIETRVSKSFKHTENPNEEITIRRRPTHVTQSPQAPQAPQATQTTIKQIQDLCFENIPDYIEYKDEISDEWVDLDKLIYLERNTGFPNPNKALEQISLMQIYDSKEKTMFVFGVRDWVHQSDYKFDYPVKYIKCKDEVDLINKYLEIFKALDPLIITAWNGDGFDFPYIFNRMKNLNIDTNKLSNHGSAEMKCSEFKGKPEYSLNAGGHFYIDLMKVYKKFVTTPRSSYALDNIASAELNESKVSHTEYAAFDDFYSGKYIIPMNPTQDQLNSKIYMAAMTKNYEEVKELAHSEFVYYGAKDTYLIRRLDESLNLTALMSMIADKMGVQISDTLRTVKPWAQYVSNKSMETLKAMPPKTTNEKGGIVGGYVRVPQKGKHKWIISEDVNSMYPLLGMVAFNMSPETYVPKHKLPPELRDIVLKYFNDQNESKRLKLPKDVKETTTNLLKQHNLSLAINGAAFDNSKIGLIPELVQDIYNTRKKAKAKMFEYEKRKILVKEILDTDNVGQSTARSVIKRDVLEYTEQELREMSISNPTELNELLSLAQAGESLFNTRQYVEKTLINSLYGALGNEWFPLFNESVAAAITGNGRFFIRSLSDYIENGLQKILPNDKKYIIYGDTDSVYCHIEPFMEKYKAKNPNKSMDEYVDFADNFENKVIQPLVQNTIVDFSTGLNAYNPDVIGVSREIVADVGIFVAKKKYVARVRDAEGTRYSSDDPYIKIMGLELIKSTTPIWAKKHLKDVVHLLLDGDETDVRDWLKGIKKEYLGADLGDITHVGGVSRVDYDLSEKGVPIGSRSAIRYNNFITDNDLLDKYAPIAGGDKCQRLFLTEPNTFQSNIIAFTSENFIDEIRKHDCVDYDTNFEKTFMKPLMIMTDALGYNLTRTTQILDDW